MTKTASSTWRDYYVLMKPGIIRGNLLTAIGGFFLGLSGGVLWGTLAALLVGMSLVIGASCVFNNYLDRNIDKHMSRTKTRALVSGRISGRAALTFGTLLAVVGFAMLLLWTNWLTAVMGLIGFVTYVGVYTPAKHRTPYATLVGTIPGAIPPVAGYTAASGRLDLACVLLFIILVCWQMPHFYAIAIRRLDEYKAADVPVWPAVYGFAATRRQMLTYMILLTISTPLLTVSGYTSWVFAVAMLLFSIGWLHKGFRDPAPENQQTWAKSVFLYSLVMLPLLAVLLVADHWVI